MQHSRVRMGSKGNEYDENCCKNASSQYSINEADALPLVKSKECENQQQAANGTTNQVSVRYSHDSFTQIAESKSVTRSSNITDPSEEVAVLISVGTVGKDQSSHNPQCEKGSCIEDSRGVEGHDDHASCVGTSKSSSLVHDSLNRSIDMKNISCSSISDGSKAATSSLNKQSCEKYICGNSVMPGGCADSSIQKVPPSLSIGISSHELESLETPLQENVDAVASSLKVQASHCNSNVMGLEKNELLQSLENLPEFSIEHMNSSAKERELDIPHGQESAACEDSKNGLIGKGSKVTVDIPPKSKVEMTEEIEDQLDATVKSFGQTEHVDKLELVELDGVQESPLESPSGDETGESDIVEQDVKVCDICGDAGREDLLAVCSRCSDGAEHTYCMRQMLKKVPEGEWLCEECKFAEESESQSQFEPDGESENASSQSSGQSINGLALKPDAKGSKAYAKATSKISSGHKLCGKRTLVNIEAGSTVKRQALEAGIGSPKPSPNRLSAISRDSSFRSIEKGKLKSVHQTSNGIHSSNYIAERARSPSNNAHPQISRGALLKSHSFSPGSLKPKIKLVDDVPLKQIGARDHASLGMKDGAVRSLGKSMSFKPTNSGRSNGTESKVKIFPPKISQDQDFKGIKHAKDHKVFERKNLPKLDRPLFSSTKISSAVSTPKGYHKPTSRGESSLSPIINNRDMKVSQSDGKLTSLSRSTSNICRKGTDTTGVSGGVSCAEQKSNQLSYKEEPSSSNANGGLQDGFSRLQESANQAEKSKESFIGRSRQTVTNGLRMVACQRCKEVGHDPESCTVAAPHASGINVSSARISRDEMKEGNTLKDAITAAALKKPGIYKKKLANKVEQQSASNTERSVGLASQDKSSVPSTLRNATSAKGIHDGQAVLQSSTLDSCRPMIVDNMEQTASNPRKAMDSLMAGDADSIMASNGKPTAREVSSYISAAMAVCKTIAIPEHEYIWQGNFELHRGGKEPELCAGIQAHVSTSASRKVVEVMNKFPLSVSFNEVPRLSTWPRQFHGSGAKEENIALYFFAKDLESYQRNYECLVERMIKNDLALKGNLDGAEILVFPSNQLPEKSQRWNMLFFLWAVFKGKKANGSDQAPNSNKLDIPSLNFPPVDKDIPGTPTSSKNHSSPKCKDENLSLCDKSFDVVLASDHLPTENSNENCNIKSEPINQKCLKTIAVSELQHSAVRSNSLHKIQTSSSMSGQEIRCVDTPMKEASDIGSKWDIDLQPSVRSFGASSSCNEGEKTAGHWDSSPDMQKNDTYSRKILPVDDGSLDEKRILDLNDNGKDGLKFEVDLVEDVSMRRVASERDLSSNEEINKWQFSRKRPHIDLGETPLEDSTGTSQNVPWSSTNKYNTLADGEGHIKKLKTETSSVYGYDGSSRGDGYARKICDLQYERPCDKKVILEDLGTAERFFFPVGSQNGKDLQLGEKVPNLELALGGETKASNKGFLLPFLSERVEKQNKHGDLATIKEEEDVSASLSLSLSFPSPDRDETVKPTPKTGALLPDMNTSLFLFGEFPDK